MVRKEGESEEEYGKRVEEVKKQINQRLFVLIHALVQVRVCFQKRSRIIGVCGSHMFRERRAKMSSAPGSSLKREQIATLLALLPTVASVTCAVDSRWGFDPVVIKVRGHFWETTQTTRLSS